jgi:hypothetical protein
VDCPALTRRRSEDTRATAAAQRELADDELAPLPYVCDTFGLARLLEALNGCDLRGCDGKHWWRDDEAKPWRARPAKTKLQPPRTAAEEQNTDGDLR